MEKTSQPPQPSEYQRNLEMPPNLEDSVLNSSVDNVNYDETFNEPIPTGPTPKRVAPKPTISPTERPRLKPEIPPASPIEIIHEQTYFPRIDQNTYQQQEPQQYYPPPQEGHCQNWNMNVDSEFREISEKFEPPIQRSRHEAAVAWMVIGFIFWIVVFRGCW